MASFAVSRLLELITEAEAEIPALWGRNDLRLVLAEAKSKALGRLNDELRQLLKEQNE